MTISPANLELAREILPHLRDSDLREIRSLSISLDELLQRSLENSTAWLAVADGRVACIWGVVDEGGPAPTRLWLMTTDLVEKHSYQFVKYSIKVLKELMRDYGWLYGYVSIENEKSERWLRRLGFKMTDPFELRPVGFVRRFDAWLP